MKQLITIKQLDELSEKGKQRLGKWVYRNLDVGHASVVIDPDHDYLLSIGQMIEFLFDKDFGPIITSNDMAFYWIVESEKKLDCWKKETYESSELVDALWEAVKEILEK